MLSHIRDQSSTPIRAVYSLRDSEGKRAGIVIPQIQRPVKRCYKKLRDALSAKMSNQLTSLSNPGDAQSFLRRRPFGEATAKLAPQEKPLEVTYERTLVWYLAAFSSDLGGRAVVRAQEKWCRIPARSDEPRAVKASQGCVRLFSSSISCTLLSLLQTATFTKCPNGATNAWQPADRGDSVPLFVNDYNSRNRKAPNKRGLSSLLIVFLFLLFTSRASLPIDPSIPCTHFIKNELFSPL